MSEMSRDGGGGYTTISAIKKRMSRYDKDGDWINPRTGLAGLLVTDKNCASKNRNENEKIDLQRLCLRLTLTLLPVIEYSNKIK